MTKANQHQRVIILGALSDIAQETARQLAAGGAALVLIARHAERLQSVAADLRVRGASSVTCLVADLVESDARTLYDQAEESLGGVIDSVLVFHGLLGDQREVNTDPTQVRTLIDTNFTSAATWLSLAAQRMLISDAEAPVVVAVSSVAGDRGRRSNYAYGAAKGGLSIFVQGLAHRLAAEPRRPGQKPMRAVLMKLGFVETSMTAHMPRGGPLWAKPEAVSRCIIAAMTKGGPIVYAPWFWRWVMLAIRSTPAFIFNKVNL